MTRKSKVGDGNWLIALHKHPGFELAKLNPETARLVKMLAKVPLFSGLDQTSLQAVAAAGREVSFESGKRILAQGEPGLSFLLVLDGTVEVQKGGKKIATLKSGNFFGEMTVFDDNPRSADIVAVESTTCFGIASWSFFPLLRTNPDISIGIIKELVKRLRELGDKSVDNRSLVE